MTGVPPTVSVIIPTYNREKLVCKAIKSVLQQTFSDFELIVVDDCSADQTQAAVEQFQDPRIRYLRHEKNAGECGARNTGLSAVQGRYVAFLDSDDEWTPQKLDKQVARFEQAPKEVGVIYTWLQVINEQDQVLRLRKPTVQGRLHDDLLYGNIIGTPSTLMVKSDYLQKTDGFDTRLRCCGDWDMWLQLARHCEFDFIAEPLVQYRDHSDAGRGSTNHYAVVEGHLIFLQKHHTTLLQHYRQLGSFPLSQKAGYLFNIGQRLLCHGNKIQQDEAISQGQKYLQTAWQANPFNLKMAFHYLSSQLGGQFYPKAVQLENKSKQTLSSIFK
ncbi:MAG: glycosyltransferase family 2 protein [Leptolyngbyaceae cyanobacterium MO_188.B28]|nr:glycosyltransferase family 2 protein [Leptolyngbyaceae cyanobacterium MO_188.B28]